MGRVRRGGHASGNAGFSLIELMVVLVLIAIMGALMIPEMRGSYEDSLLRSTGRNLASAFSFAHSRAITLNEVQRFRIDQQENTYHVEGSGGGAGGAEDAGENRNFPGSRGKFNHRVSMKIQSFKNEDEDSPNEVARSPGDEFTQGFPDDSGQGVIRFFPDGTADRKEVVLEDSQGFGIALRINPITARVTIVELDRK